MSPPSAALLLMAAGASRRMGAAGDKLQFELGGRPVWRRALEAFAGVPSVARRVMVLPSGTTSGAWADQARAAGVDRIAAGGARRSDSVRAGLAVLMSEDDIDVVLIHDAARPLVSRAVIIRVLEAARSGPAAPVVAPRDTMRLREREGWRVVDREALRLCQTPQGFPLPLIRRAYDALGDADVTDDIEVAARAGYAPVLVEGEAANLKLTTPEDLDLAQAWWSLRGPEGRS